MYSTKMSLKNKPALFQNYKSVATSVCYKYFGLIICTFFIINWVLNKLGGNDQLVFDSSANGDEVYYKNATKYWRNVMSVRPTGRTDIKTEEEGTIENFNGSDTLMFYDQEFGPLLRPACVIDSSVLGPVEVTKQNVTMDWASSQLQHIKQGGVHTPKGCRAKYKLAILVPFRDRVETLAKFLYHMHTFLMKQMLEYRIIVVKQKDHSLFNKGALLNAGYLASQKLGEYNCYIFHDVNLLPLDSRNFYTCNVRPMVLATIIENYYFGVPQGRNNQVKQNVYGGVTMFPQARFRLVNGYSNCYRGDGAELDLFIRLTLKGHCFLRATQMKGRYARIDTDPKASSPNVLMPTIDRSQKFKLVGTASARGEGLNTVDYKLVSIKEQKLYTHIIVDISAMNNKLSQELCLKLGNIIYNDTN